MHGSDPEFQVPVSQVTLGLVVRPVFYSVSSTSKNSLKQKQVCTGEGVLVRGVFISTRRHSLPSRPLRKEWHVHPWGKWLHISDVSQWWFSPPLWLSPWIAARLACLSSSGEQPIPCCRAFGSCIIVTPWNPHLWGFNQIKPAFSESF